MLRHFGEQLLMSVGKFGRALNDSVFQGFVEMAKLKTPTFFVHEDASPAPPCSQPI